MSEWTDFFDTPAGATGGLLGIGELDLLHVRDEKVINTQGGSSSASTWNQRDLNTVLVNEIDGSSLSSDQITLPAGTYDIEASAPCNTSDRHRLRFRNITDGSTAVAGMSLHSSATDNQTPHSLLTGRFIITEEKVFQLQQWTQTAQASNGLGVATNSVEVEVYADVRIRRVTAVQGAGGLPFKGIRRHRTTQSASFPTGATNDVLWDDADEIQYDIGGWESSDTEIVIPEGITKVKMVFGYFTNAGSLDAGEIQFHIRRTSGGGGTIGATVVENIETTIPNKGNVDTGTFEVTPGETFKVDFGHNTGGNQFLAATETFWSVEAVEAIAPSTTPRGALVKRTGTFALANDSEVALPFDDEEYDTDDIHNNSVNNTRLTVPTGVTHVRLYGFMQVGSDTSGYRSLRTTKNGSTFVGQGFSDTSAASRNTQELNVNSAIVEVVGGNYFELVGFQNAGETRNVTPYFAMEIVAPAVVAAGLTDVVDDITPQLGGNLDANTFDIEEDGNVILSFTSGGETAVNWIDIEHATTGSGPVIRSVGADTNVDLNIEAKGTGAIVFASPLALGPAPLVALDTVIDGGFTIPAIAAGPPSFVDVAFGTAAPTGAAGDSVILGFLSPPPPGLMFNAFIIAPTAIIVRIADVTGAGFAGGALPLKATVMSF